jgi:hypothetical protein|tara:strand:+ start:349 stop:1140 length:792 start_codon:yes stop_codon:yes gene_type:complete
MAETLSYQPETNTETLESSLTPEEQESLAVGEKLQQDQEQLLAGKYKDATELEKAYIELQKKLGEQKQEDTEQASAKEPVEEPQISEGASLITSAQEEYYKNGNKLSDETLAKFSEMSSADLISAYIEMNGNNPQTSDVQVNEITQDQINEIKGTVGGDKQYANVINWAKTSLDNGSIEAFDEVVNTGSISAIKLAVSGLKAEYDKANGTEGRMITGKAPVQSGDVFRSQAELVRAMADPRYDSDPAYRNDVVEKLDRSNLEF